MGLPPSVESFAHSGETGMKPEYDRIYSPRDHHDTLIKALKPTPSVRQEMPPHMRPPSTGAQPRQDEFRSEKKRNKLGYRRISVACNHCRHRKIRCISNGLRCISCDRLQRVCTFSAVNKQPVPRPRGKPGSRSALVAGKVGSAAFSPVMPHAGGHQGEMAYPAHNFMSSMSQLASSRALERTFDAFSPDNEIPAALPTTSSFEYGHGGITNWTEPEASPNTTKPGDMGSNWMTCAQDSPVTPVTFYPYRSHTPTPSTRWASPTATVPTSRDDITGSFYPPSQTRSISFGFNSMSSPQHSHQQYLSVPQMAGSGPRPYERKASAPMPTDMYSPPIATGVEVIPGTTTLDHGVSLSAGAVPPANYGAWQQRSYAAKPDQGWYGESSSPLGSDGQMVHSASGESQQHGVVLYFSR